MLGTCSWFFVLSVLHCLLAYIKFGIHAVWSALARHHGSNNPINHGRAVMNYIYQMSISYLPHDYSHHCQVVSLDWGDIRDVGIVERLSRIVVSRCAIYRSHSSETLIRVHQTLEVRKDLIQETSTMHLSVLNHQQAARDIGGNLASHNCSYIIEASG